MSKKQEDNLFMGMRWLIRGGIFAALVLAILFLTNQTYDRKLPVDTGIFGTYGDFIGGVLGTIVALYSAYLLIKTLQSQADVNKDIEATNASVIKTNESIIAANTKADAASQQQYYQNALQVFDSKFCRFFDSYQRAINSYEDGGLKGRSAFEVVAKSFINMDFVNNNDYKRRCDSATGEYLEFYAKHQTEMSVHFRVLYLLVALISKSELEEDDKVQYAKLVRGQLSNAEMLIIRYNCRSPYGRKMQNFCNQFNLTKHLSVTSLLEFKTYRNVIEQDGTEEGKKLLSGMDVMFITLRKKATKMLYEGNSKVDEYKTSHSYTIKLDFSAVDKKSFVLGFNQNKKVSRRGGGARISPDECALDRLDENQILELFKDFMHELFIESNFSLYNEGIIIKQLGSSVSNGNEYSFKIQAENQKELALSFQQMATRDNPVGELE